MIRRAANRSFGNEKGKLPRAGKEDCDSKKYFKGQKSGDVTFVTAAGEGSLPRQVSRMREDSHERHLVLDPYGHRGLTFRLLCRRRDRCARHRLERRAGDDSNPARLIPMANRASAGEMRSTLNWLRGDGLSAVYFLGSPAASLRARP